MRRTSICQLLLIQCKTASCTSMLPNTLDLDLYLVSCTLYGLPQQFVHNVIRHGGSMVCEGREGVMVNLTALYIAFIYFLGWLSLAFHYPGKVFFTSRVFLHCQRSASDLLMAPVSMLSFNDFCYKSVLILLL